MEYNQFRQILHTIMALYTMIDPKDQKSVSVCLNEHLWENRRLIQEYIDKKGMKA